MPVASRIIRSTLHIESLFTGMPAVVSKPATIRPLEKPTTRRRYRPSTPTKPPRRTSKNPAKHFIANLDMPELPPFNEPPYSNPTLVPAKSTFSFEQAKSHLIKADTRFEQLFASVQCQPFEQSEPINPFRNLVASVLGIGGKHIRHRFLRLFDRSLPEEVPLTHEQEMMYEFPSPGRVASVSAEILRTTRMNESQAEHVLDIAKRFVGGRLSSEKLVNASDEQAEETIVGLVGKEKADIFAITTLRRPNILPVGSPKTQKGLLNWVLSSHEPENYPLYINPTRLPKPNQDELEKSDVKVTEPVDATPTPEVSTLAVKVKESNSKQLDGVLVVPTNPVQLPEGMTLDTLKARANREEATGRYLLPNEMEALTASWKPYRSLGVFYMWALVGKAK
ncbi:DNA-3-methyladenine glycosylase II [Rhizoctonia solani]|uniref:DNA-3-methyladenine glycosylase II n=1 Tax=Rhizoctonia solani TaxID=456999 RepID=A0A0K6FK44_9AGAM|nr:DNA-3-methyladenine glycosylase II [Rhizoctonia solani]